MNRRHNRNPFSVGTTLTEQRGVFGDHARRVRGWFLYREIDFEEPFVGRFVYSGWWFRQTIEIDGIPLWRRISWVTIHRQAAFRVPPQLLGSAPEGRMEIDFSRGLLIRRFRIWIDGVVVYDEIL